MILPTKYYSCVFIFLIRDFQYIFNIYFFLRSCPKAPKGMTQILNSWSPFHLVDAVQTTKEEGRHKTALSTKLLF